MGMWICCDVNTKRFHSIRSSSVIEISNDHNRLAITKGFGFDNKQVSLYFEITTINEDSVASKHLVLMS